MHDAVPMPGERSSTAPPRPCRRRLARQISLFRGLKQAHIRPKGAFLVLPARVAVHGGNARRNVVRGGSDLRVLQFLLDESARNHSSPRRPAGWWPRCRSGRRPWRAAPSSKCSFLMAGAGSLVFRADAAASRKPSSARVGRCGYPRCLARIDDVEVSRGSPAHLPGAAFALVRRGAVEQGIPARLTCDARGAKDPGQSVWSRFVSLLCPGSSVAEQRTRNAQVVGSNPTSGSGRSSRFDLAHLHVWV